MRHEERSMREEVRVLQMGIVWIRIQEKVATSKDARNYAAMT